MKSVLTLLVASLLIAGSTLAQEPEPLGEDFQVNTYTTDVQRFPSVAADAQGNFVVVWTSEGSYGTDNNHYSIQGQRYDATGTPIGEQFQSNSYWPYDQEHPVVASDAQGNFVVVWHSWGSYFTDTSHHSIQAQRFDSTGTPVGGEFQVNSYWTNSQKNPSVTVDPKGDFVVVWEDNGSSKIQAQRFDASGIPVGVEFQVNSYPTGGGLYPSVASDAQGNFIVVWQSRGTYGTDTSVDSIQAQRYDATGTPVGGQFQVNSFTGGYQMQPAVAVGPQGNFVVVWESDGSYDLDTKDTVRAKAFDADGNPIGGFFSEFQVNSYGTGRQSGPAVLSDAQDNFVVTWFSDGSYGTDTSLSSIQGQRIAADRTFLGDEFQVNSFTTNRQHFPALAIGPSGQLVVVWHSYASGGDDTSSTSIQARRFDTGIFTDGFESGDTSAWSRTVQE